MPSKKKKNAQEEKDKTYQPGDEENDEESEDEEEEEEEEEESEDTEDSDSNDDIHDAQQFIKESKKSSKKNVSKANSSPIKLTIKKKSMEQSGNSGFQSGNSGMEMEENNANVKKPRGRKRKINEVSATGTTETNTNTETNTITEVNEAGSSTSGTNKKKTSLSSLTVFNDANVDVNLYHEAPANIKVKKIKLSASLIVMCHVLDGLQAKLPFNNDFPALTFLKKMKDNKAYNFSIPFNLTPTLQNALQIMIEANTTFFNNQRRFGLQEN